MPHLPKPKTNEVKTASAVDPAAICSAWWMYDNHTFQKVDVTEPNWRGYVMTCYDIDGFGSFFVRESPNGKTIFDLHGRGKEGRKAFAAALDAWTPPNASVEQPPGRRSANTKHDLTTMAGSAVATIRRKEYPEYYMGWVVEHDAPKWTSYALDAAPVPLEILMAELNKVAAREVNAWAVIYPQNKEISDG